MKIKINKIEKIETLKQNRDFEKYIHTMLHLCVFMFHFPRMSRFPLSMCLLLTLYNLHLSQEVFYDSSIQKEFPYLPNNFFFLEFSYFQ